MERYRRIWVNGQYVAEHRHVMEQKLGRALLPGEHVHHLNENKHDNRPENLALTNAREHGLHHHPPVLPTTTACVVCGTVFTPHKTKRARQQTCSWRCRNALIARRKREQPQRSHCDAGHALAGDNAYAHGGRLHCRECRRQAAARSRARRASA